MLSKTNKVILPHSQEWQCCAMLLFFFREDWLRVRFLVAAVGGFTLSLDVWARGCL
jgi:hypothetical protein